MSSKGCKPLPNACVKNLCDKLFEKRKAGAIEVEQLVKTYVQKEKTEEIEKILQILGQDFIISPNINVRKGGLFGLASVAIGLGQSCPLYADALIAPIFQALRDSDSQIRYCACESLYNILKVLQVHALLYFNDLFEALCTATADAEMSVRQVVDHCDRLLRDIVIQNRTINVNSFMNIISERLQTRVPFTRKFVVCWISTLISVPEFKILQNIPQILDSLLNILRDENPDIRRNCDILLNEFLSGIVQSPESVDVIQLITILIPHCRESTNILAPGDDKSVEVALNTPSSNLPPERLRQITVLHWIRQFITISTTNQLKLLPLVAQILSAVLLCLDDRDEIDDRTALKRALDINEELMKFVHNLRNADQEGSGNGISGFDCAAILATIYMAFEHRSILTRLAALRWVEVLLAVNPEAIFENSSDLMPLLLKLLSDPAVEVVHSTVSLVGSLCKHPAAQRFASSSKEDSRTCRGGKISSVQRLFTTLMSEVGNVEGASTADCERASLLCLRFLYDLVQIFIADPRMLNEKGNLIITDLCLALGAQSVYYVMALIISNLLKPKQAFDIVQMLNQILLTQPSVLTFREFLHNIDLEKDADLFEELYRAWCHNPVALLAFCLLTQNYSHCRVLVKSFGDLTMSVEILAELDRLIQLIESPVFARLRLHLVDRRHSAALQETLYCLLMCLPQTEAFDTLRRRLQCLPSNMLNESDGSAAPTGKVNFKSLLAHFRAVQRQHDEFSLREGTLTSSGQRDGLDASIKASIPVELGFMQSNDVVTNQKIANSTQFLVKGLQKLGIEALPPCDSN